MYCDQCLLPIKVGQKVVVEQNYLLEKVLIHEGGCHQDWLNGRPKKLPDARLNRQADNLLQKVALTDLISVDESS